MAIDRLMVWVSGQTLYASDLNAEFTNITNQVLPGPGKFSVSGNLHNEAGIVEPAINLSAWVAPIPCTAVSIKIRVVGGTSATVNARKNGTSNLLAANSTVTPADGWKDVGTLQNASFLLGNNLEFMMVSIVGGVTQIFWQVNFTNP